MHTILPHILAGMGGGIGGKGGIGGNGGKGVEGGSGGKVQCLEENKAMETDVQLKEVWVNLVATVVLVVKE